MTAVTEYHTLSGLKNSRLFLSVLEARKSKVKELVDSVSGDNPALNCRLLLSGGALT